MREKDSCSAGSKDSRTSRTSRVNNMRLATGETSTQNVWIGPATPTTRIERTAINHAKASTDRQRMATSSDSLTRLKRSAGRTG